jgi:hypothetical protein
LLHGKRKVSFSLSLQINDLFRQSLIWAPPSGRIDDFLRSHQLWSDPVLVIANPKIANFLILPPPDRRGEALCEDGLRGSSE